MASDQDKSFASAFDSLLDQNRKQFDELFRRSGAAMSEAQQIGETPSRKPTMPAPSIIRASLDDSESARTLNRRFGTGWDYEITERRLEGDEAIVLGKLKIPAKNLTKAQFGHAALDSSRTGSKAENAAYSRAAETALARCVALL